MGASTRGGNETDMDRQQNPRVGLAGLLAAGLCAAGLACEPAPPKQSLKVAYSGIGDPNSWFLSFSDQMSAQAGARGHWFFDRIATFDNSEQRHQDSQTQQVRDLMSLKPDVLVLGPVAVNRAMVAIQVANDAGVPVILVNRDAEDPTPAVSDRYFTTIHSDFYAFGKEVCGKQLRKVFGDKRVKLLHLKGTEGGSNTIGMNNGCKDAMRADGDMEITCEDNGNYDQAQAYAATKRQIAAGCDFNAVFGHGDTEGLGAVQALLEAAVTNPKYKPGIDPTKGEIIVTACDASKPVIVNIKAGLQYGAMTTSPYYADQVFDAIEKHFAGEIVPPFIPVIDFFIDVSNISRYEAFGF
jgi:ABC-type sugar transport system substrate-binding protein